MVQGVNGEVEDALPVQVSDRSIAETMLNFKWTLSLNSVQEGKDYEVSEIFT